MARGSQTSDPTAAAQCSIVGCTRISDTSDDQGRCAYHRQKMRNAAGLCPNCGGTMTPVPVTNSLTGRQLRDANTGELRWTNTCTGCGYEQQRGSPRTVRRRARRS